MPPVQVLGVHNGVRDRHAVSQVRGHYGRGINNGLQKQTQKMVGVERRGILPLLQKCKPKPTPFKV